MGAFQAGECGVALVGLALDTPQPDGHTMDVRRTVQPPCPNEPHIKRPILQVHTITGMWCKECGKSPTSVKPLT
ncbi:hypothetical protein GCM10027570_34700 [Streptomonospora sediminis]